MSPNNAFYRLVPFQTLFRSSQSPFSFIQISSNWTIFLFVLIFTVVTKKAVILVFSTFNISLLKSLCLSKFWNSLPPFRSLPQFFWFFLSHVSFCIYLFPLHQAMCHSLFFVVLVLSNVLIHLPIPRQMPCFISCSHNSFPALQFLLFSSIHPLHCSIFHFFLSFAFVPNTAIFLLSTFQSHSLSPRVFLYSLMHCSHSCFRQFP